VRNEERFARERRKPLHLGANQEMDLQPKEGLQVLQGNSRKEQRPEEYPQMHTAAARGVLLLLPCHNNTISITCAPLLF